jgi:hypothetical protein
MLPLLLIGLAINSMRARVVVTPDSIEIRNTFYTRRIKRSDILGSRTIYDDRWQGDQLWLYDKTGDAVPLPRDFKDWIVDNSWVSELDDLDEVDARRAYESAARDDRWGKSEADRRWNASQWQGRTNVLNSIALVVLVFAIHIPTGLDTVRWTIVLALTVMPPLAAILMYVTDGAVDIYHRGRDEGPNLQGLSLAPLLMLWLAFHVEGGRWGSAWGLGFGLAIPATLWIGGMMRRAGHSMDIRGPMTFIFAVIYFASAILLFREHREILRERRATAVAVAQVHGVDPQQR